MKSYAMPFLLLFCFAIHAYAQKVPTVETTINSALSYSETDFKNWDRFILLNKNVTENGNSDVLSPDDKRFYDKYATDHPDAVEYERAPWLTEDIGCSWYCGAIYQTDVSSCLPSSGDNKYNKECIFDGNSRTAWVEGAKGQGIGQYVEFTFEYTAPRATHCYIANGYNKDERTWKNNSRVKTFNMYVDDKLTAIINMKDTRDMQEFEFPHPVPNRPDNFVRSNYDDEKPKPAVKLKFVITEVYKGNKYDDTAISELSFAGMDVHCLAQGTQITMTNGTTKAIELMSKGDKVKTYNTDSKTWNEVAVTQIYEVAHANVLKISFDSGISIIATDDHPFWTTEGWKSFDPQKTKHYKRYASAQIGKYDVGSKISTVQENVLSESSITSIEKISATTKTYTLELENADAFVANGTLAGQE